KPVDFDLPALAHHQPAAFIASPVIKALDRARLPVLEDLSGVMARWDPNAARAFFIYGGHWLARPEPPPRLQHKSFVARSSSQAMLTASGRVTPASDADVSARSLQREAGFLQLGPLAFLQAPAIAAMAEMLPVSA